ncbi:hypothetical protein [Paenibacillus aestuarii]|uniref:DUF4878 domain-containing protein n=1 Tax=Paenibacillus aestuarii TaxID=516965 RepID=A0ABW0K3Y8_9BACL|nr:hypothetical protein [Paenibacillus aestuarii]
MKTIKLVTLGAAAIAVIASAIWFSAPSSEAAIPDVQAAKQSVTNYIDAIEKHDVNELIKWVKDSRFNSLEEQKTAYATMFSNDPFEKAVITTVKKVDDNNLIVSLKLIRKGNGKSQTLDLPLIKDNGSWKLYITGVETKE